MLARVGVKVDLNAEPKSKFFAAHPRGRAATIRRSICSAGRRRRSKASTSSSTSWAAATRRAIGGDNNVGDYCNPKVDELANAGPAGAGRGEARRDLQAGLADRAVRRRGLHSAASAGSGLGRVEEGPCHPARRQFLRPLPGSRWIEAAGDRPHALPPSGAGDGPSRTGCSMLAFILRRLFASIGVLIAVGADRVHAVPLCRRSGEPDGRHRDLAAGARAPAPAARPRTTRRSCRRCAFSATRRVSISASPTSSSSRSPI